MKYVLIIVALLLTNTSFADKDTIAAKDDFAYGYSLEVDGDGAIYSLYLNEKIYQGMVHEDRGDLRIFNSLGEVVPHVIRRAERLTKKATPTAKLAYFPLYKKDKSESINAAASNIRITTNDQGTILDLNYGKAEIKDRYLSAYIIDASTLTDAPDSLYLDWETTNQNFILNVYLEGSDDLNQWRTLKSSTTLSNMQFNNHTLIQREISLPEKIPKYLRLGWYGDAEFSLKTLNAQFSDSYQSQPRRWSVFLPADIDKVNSVYYFETKSVIPGDRLNINLPTKNTLVKVLIESASKAEGPWFNRFHGLLYDLKIDQNQLVNPDIHQAVNSHRHWRVQILNSGGDFGGKPQLRIGWIPEQLLFVATGESPFTLAYGSARVGNIMAPLGQLLSESAIKQQASLIKSAKLGAAIDFGTPSRLQPPRPEMDWKRYILWAVLIVGVFLLAFMAFRLFKQMEQSDQTK